MSNQRFPGINSNGGSRATLGTWNGATDRQILISVDAGFYGIQINYSGFVPNASTGFKLLKTYSNIPSPENIIEIPDAEFVITDGSGVIVFKNAVVEVATFLVLEYTSDSNDVNSEYTIYSNFRN